MCQRWGISVCKICSEYYLGLTSTAAFPILHTTPLGTWTFTFVMLPGAQWWLYHTPNDNPWPIPLILNTHKWSQACVDPLPNHNFLGLFYIGGKGMSCFPYSLQERPFKTKMDAPPPHFWRHNQFQPGPRRLQRLRCAWDLPQARISILPAFGRNDRIAVLRAAGVSWKKSTTTRNF